MRLVSSSPSSSALYLASEDAVMRVPAQRCTRFPTERECLNAMDPYCGWNGQKSACVPTPNGYPRAAYWQQEPITCPVLTDPVREQMRFNRSICLVWRLIHFGLINSLQLSRYQS